MRTPTRTPKLYLDNYWLNKLKSLNLNLKVHRNPKGQEFIVFSDFPSVAKAMASASTESSREKIAYGLLVIFRDILKKTPEEQLEEYKSLPKHDLEKRVLNDIIRIVQDMRSKDYSESNIRNHLNAFKKWLAVNIGYIPPQDLIRYSVRISPSKRSSEDRPPTHYELRLILLATTKIYYKALFSFQSASGIRLGETLSLRMYCLEKNPLDLPDDYDEPLMIRITPKISKEAVEHVTFIHPECVKLLKQYLEWRLERARRDDLSKDDYLFAVIKQGKEEPMNINTVERAWSRSLERAGLKIESSKSIATRYILRIHGLRKFFRTNIVAGGCPPDMAEIFMGHKPYLATYIKYDVNTLRLHYKKAMHNLMVLERRIVESPEQIESRVIELAKREAEKIVSEKLRELSFTILSLIHI